MAAPVFGFKGVEPRLTATPPRSLRHHGGFTMIEELTRFHRSTALHIQRQLSARPRAGNFVAHPLNFLHESPFLPYKGGEIDNRIKNEVLDQASMASRGELLTYGEPLAILSESGSGKSILVARVAQRLMEAIHKNPEADVLVLFAQLKHAQGTDLLQEICSSVGLGRFSNLEELRLYLPEELRTHRLILLIDSLDESQHRKDWHRLDRELRQPLAAPASDGLNDVLPVWVSRRHDWQGFSPDPYKALQGLLKSESLSLNINGNKALGKALHSLFKERQNEMEQRYGEP